MMRQFHTPPINNSSFDTSVSVKESYRQRQSGIQITNNEIKEEDEELIKDAVEISEGAMELAKDDIDRFVDTIMELPEEQSRLIDIFITDLKQPKYARPLTILQLSYLFQGFYTKFDKSCFQYLSNNSTSVSTNGSYFSAREVLSTGLSGIFARSRSSSTASGTSLSRVPRRSSSLFSLESNSKNVTQLLSPEEIKDQIKRNELNNLKIEKYMTLCEQRVFRKLIEVGTSVSSPIKLKPATPPRNGLSSDQNDRHYNNHYDQEVFKISSLFRNTPEYGEYDKMLTDKLKCLSRLSLDGKINLDEFLGIPNNIKLNNEKSNDDMHEALMNFCYYSVSPFDKIEILLKIHDIMTFSKDVSNDEFLSLLIFYIIKFSPKKLFLNAEFIKLFRYKKKLVQNELYALTNLEAALMFVEGLTLDDFSGELRDELSPQERNLLEKKVSDRIALPVASKTFKHSTDISLSNQIASTQSINYQDGTVLMSTSNEGFRTTFDSSVRNIIDKIKSYTPPNVNNLKPLPLPLPRSTSQLSMDFERGSPIRVNKSSNHQTSNSNTSIGPVMALPSPNDSIPESWKRFKDCKFEDLKINELNEIFEIYQKMIE